MSFKTYLPQKFEYTHESKYFREFNELLKQKYSDTDNLSVLIGNLNCNGHQIDALFVSSGKIVVIDFKNYGGKLEFHTVNPWKMWKNNVLTFVSGGNSIRNPYQQLQAYKHSIQDFISPRLQKVLDVNHDNFKLYKLNCCVLFQQDIEFDSAQITEPLKKYFHVTDYKGIINLLEDIHSNNLLLSDIEIEKFLGIFNISSNNLYISETDTATGTKTPVTFGNINTDLIKQILPSDTENIDERTKILCYYKTILELEILKDNYIKNRYEYKTKLEDVNDTLSVSLSDNKDFISALLSNQNSQFPKNIFVGINVKIQNEIIPLLYTIVFTKEINENSVISEKLSQFVLYRKILEEKGLEADLLDELEILIEQAVTLSDKLQKLKEIVAQDIELYPTLSIGLSEENFFNKQLQSELNRLIKYPENHQSVLLNNFLEKLPVQKSDAFESISSILQVTKLNNEQKDAVKLSFNQPLTVITGPPGTGKTQVVINILTTALMNGKKVIFASKNNKAVENVKTRLQELMDEQDFLCRFGSKEEIVRTLKPQLERIVKKIQANAYQDRRNELSEAIDEYLLSDSIIERIKKDLASIPMLEREIDILNNDLQKKTKDYENWYRLLPDHHKLFLERDDILIQPSLIEKIKTDLDYLHKYVHGIKKFYFNLFLKNRSFAVFDELLSELPNELISFVEVTAYRPSKIKKDIIELCNYYSTLLTASKDIYVNIERNADFNNKINESKANIAKLTTDLNKLVHDKEKLKSDLIHYEEVIPIQGKKLLQLMINQALHTANADNINKYLNYIPDDIPWKYNELLEFTNYVDYFLDTFKAVSITSLTLKNAFPLEDELFDIAVIDEASQCDITSAIPIILRAKQLVVIGDPLQLKHITKLNKTEEKYIKSKLNLDNPQNYDYVNKSLFDYCFDIAVSSKLETVFLKQHHRCHKEIIEFSSKTYYLPALGQELEILTNMESMNFEPIGFNWVNVNGSQSDNKNLNADEIEKCCSLAKILTSRYPNASLGITTPFKHQAESIRNRFPDITGNRITADVVHSFQGDEKDIILLSLVATSNSPESKSNWINESVPFLINVAVTRAKSTLIVVGNLDYCLSTNSSKPLYKLANYARNLNKVIEL